MPEVKAKKRCCKSGPRCTRCPVVLRRLENAGLAEHVKGRRYHVSKKAKGARLKAARDKR